MPQRITSAILACMVVLTATAAHGVYFPSVVDLADPFNASTMDVDGGSAEGLAGYAVCGGDIDGDGFHDLIAGAYKAGGGRGITYVLFGSGEAFDISRIDLAGDSEKVTITGRNVLDWSGSALAVGDVNNDGFDDIIIGAYRHDPGGRINAGEVYVVMGAADVRSRGDIDLATASSGVVTISGDDNEDNAGYAVAAGDVNGDSYTDVIIGAHRADYVSRIDAGEAYVVFGGAGFGDTGAIDLSGSPAGVLRIFGEDGGDAFGSSAAVADIDNDGDCEIIIGAPNAYDNRGAVYVISGSAGLSAEESLDTADPVDGMTVVYGIGADDHLGDGVAAGNIDGDAFNDVIINIPRAGQDGGFDEGKTSILFGSAAFGDIGRVTLGAFTDAMLGIYYWESPDEGLRSVSAGDLNGDGFDDVIIGVKTASPSDRATAGKVIVVYGDPDIDTMLAIDMRYDVAGSAVVCGGNTGDAAGSAVAAFDHDGDGVDDLVIGAPGADSDGMSNTGSIMILKGWDTTDCVSRNPRDGAYANRDTMIEAVFNTDMDSYTVVVTEDGSPLTPGSLVTGARSMQYTGWRDFTPGSDIEVGIDGENAAGEPVALSWEFHVKTDESPPQIFERAPLPDESNVTPDENIVITFSGDIDPDSTFVTVAGSSSGGVTVTETWADSMLTLTHAEAFALGETVTVTVDAGDEYGDREGAVSWTFTVRPETTPPWFTVTVPGATGYIQPDAIIRLTFPADVDKSSVNASLEGNVTGVVSGAWIWADTTCTFTPSQQYAPGETLVLVAGASDIHRNATGDSLFTFNVKPDIEPPAVLDRTPAPDASNISVHANIAIEFTQDIHPDSTTIIVEGAGTGAVNYTQTWVDYTAMLDPAVPFAAADTINVSVDAGDEYGNRAEYSWLFVTRPDEEPPLFRLISPPNVASVSTADVITLAFPSDVHKPSVDISLTGDIAGTVSGAWSWADTLYRFDHAAPFTAGDSMTLQVSASDIYGNAFTDSTIVMYVRPDENPPDIVTRTPAPGAVNVALDAPAIIGFSADIVPDSTDVTLFSDLRSSIAASHAWTDSTLTVTPSGGTWLQDESVTVTLSASDQYGNRRYENWMFGTGGTMTSTFYHISLTGERDEMPRNAVFTVEFTDRVDIGTVNASFSGSVNGTLAGTTTWTGRALSFAPESLMTPGETVTITIAALDTAGAAIPVTPETAVVGLHTPWAAVSEVSFADSSDMSYRIDFVTGDPDGSYMVTRGWAYRIGTGEWNDISADHISQNANSPPGTHYLLWEPASALRGVYTEAMHFRMEAYDGRYASGPVVSPPFRFDWNSPPVVSVNDVTVDYEQEKVLCTFLISDTERDSVSVAYEYSTDGGMTWTAGAPDRSLEKLPYGSYSGSFGWNYRVGLDAGAEYPDFRARLVPEDYKQGVPGMSDTLAIDLNEPPEAAIDDLFAPQSGDIELTYHLSDAEQDTLELSCFYSVDDGLTWIETVNVTGNISITGYDGVIVWHSKEDIPSIESFNVRFRIVPSDGDIGAAAETGPFQLINNSPPSIAFTLPDTVSNTVRIPAIIGDVEGDPVTVHADWRTDDSEWQPAAILTELSGIITGAHADTLVWDTRNDTGNAFIPSARLRLTATDAHNGPDDSSTKSAIDTLTIDNEFPSITGLTGYAGGDTVYVNFSEPIDAASAVSAEFSIVPDVGIERIIAGDSAERYLMVLDGTLPRTGAVAVTVTGISDRWGNTAAELTGSFVPGDDNTDPRLTLGVLPEEVSGDVNVSYTIIDLEGDAVSLSVDYSIDGGATWNSATVSGATADIEPAGYNGSFIWHSAADAPGKETEGVLLRAIPADSQAGAPAFSAPFRLDNNLPPSVTLSVADPDSVYSGQVVVSHAIENPEGDYTALEVEYSLDNGDTFQPATLSSFGYVFSPTTYHGTFIWHTEEDIPDGFGHMLLIARPEDSDSGPPDSLRIWVDNYGVSRVRLTMPEGEQADDVTVQYHVTDPHEGVVSLSAEYSLDGGVEWLPAVIEGGQNLGPSDYAGQILWRSSGPLAGYDGTARLKLIPSNGVEGICGAGEVAVDYNRPPIVSVAPVAAEISGDVEFACSVTDDEADTVSIEMEVSIDGGMNWYEADVHGNSDVPGDGSTATVVWDSAGDLPNRETRNLSVRFRARDADPGEWTVLGSLHLDNNLPPSISLALDHPDSVRTEYADIAYHIDDAEQNMSTLTATYSTDDGRSYSPATVTGNVSGIFSSAYDGTIRWELEEDIPAGAGDAVFKVLVSDEDPGMADSLRVRYNTYGICTITLTAPAEEQEGDVPIEYAIGDAKGNPVDLAVEFSINKFGIWQPAAVSGSLEGINPEGYEGSFIWHAPEDIGSYQGAAQLRITPDNGGGGVPAVIEFAVDNNSPPVIVSAQLDTEQEHSGDILISYQGADDENDPFTAGLDFSLDDGATWHPAASTGGAAVRPGMNGVITWRSFADVGYAWKQEVRLALTPSDGDPGPVYPLGPVTVTNLVGDFNYDLRIDGDDLLFFIDAWNDQDISKELGPVTGTPPELATEPDGRIDFEDLAAFVWMWNWYSGRTAGKSLTGNESNPAKPATGGNQVTVSPDGGGHLRIDASVPLDYFRITASPGSGASMSLAGDGYWDASRKGVILSREYPDGSAELAAARFSDIPATEVSPGTIRIEGIQADVEFMYAWRRVGTDTIHSRSLHVARDDLAIAPTAYALGVNSPNPFNPSTTITYSLPVDANVRLSIFSSTGQEVAVLCDKSMPAGMHSIVWNAAGMPSGLYFYRLVAGSFRDTKKMLLLK